MTCTNKTFSRLYLVHFTDYSRFLLVMHLLNIQLHPPPPSPGFFG